MKVDLEMTELERGRVAHAVPGRVRIKVDVRTLAEDRASRLRMALLSLPDIEAVQTTPSTGSIVVVYDPDALNTPGLIDRVRKARLLALDPPEHDLYAGRRMPLSETAQGIHRTFGGANARLWEITKGKWDLRSVMPFALGALALRQLVANPGALGTAPWYVLAWYAFDSFLKLNAGPTDSGEDDDDLMADE